MSMRAYYDLKEMLCAEVDEIAKKQEMSAGDLEAVHKLTDTIKNIDKILMLEEDGGYSRDGYSRDGDWEADMRGSYNRGASYRHRDSMGRYARTGDDYSRRRGYSRHEAKDMMMEQLGGMMNDANENQREVIRRAMRELEDM